MSLTALFMPQPRGGAAGRREEPLGEWPPKVERTPAQLAACRVARKAQIGKTKAPNRVKR